MKPGLLYGIIFFVVFILVTGGIYFLADTNPSMLYISALHSKPSHSEGDAEGGEEGSEGETTTFRKMLKLHGEEEDNGKEFYVEQDTLNGKIFRTRVEIKYDTVYVEKLVKDPAVVDSLKAAKHKTVLLAIQNKRKDRKIKELEKRIIQQKDSAYAAWLKATVKLYESMDSKQAAKLIQNFSDSEARDLIYSMKKKKAAEILSNLSAEKVTILTRSK
jgi:flagellar motility protein MotE (MotC chaperone)